MTNNIVGVAGDWHGDTAWALAVLDYYRDRNITTIYHLGDFGIWGGHDGASFLQKVSRRLVKNGQVIRVTLGNHEDYVRANSRFLPVEDGEHAGWLNWPAYPGIYVAPRGHRWEDGGRSFVSLGGANSINREDLTPGVSWFAEEQISLGDAYRTVAGGHAEVFLAHEAPAGARLFESTHADPRGWTAKGIAYANESRFMMRQVVDAVQPDLFLHGHYHHLLRHDVELTTGDGNAYQFHGYCLNMNGFQGNVGLLNLDNLEMEFPVTPFGK